MSPQHAASHHKKKSDKKKRSQHAGPSTVPHSSEQVEQPQAADLMARDISLADIIEQNKSTKDNKQKRTGKAKLSPAALQQVEAAAQQRQHEQIRFRQA